MAELLIKYYVSYYVCLYVLVPVFSVVNLNY